MTHDELLAKIQAMEETYTRNKTLVLGSALAYNALCAVVELAGKDIEHESYVWLDGYDYAMKQIIQAIEKELN